jgi:hypothetical protein
MDSSPPFQTSETLKTEGRTVEWLLELKPLLNWETHKIAGGEKGPIVAARARVGAQGSRSRTTSKSWSLTPTPGNGSTGRVVRAFRLRAHACTRRAQRNSDRAIIPKSRNVVPFAGENAGCTSKRIPAQQRPDFRRMKNETTKTIKPNKSTDAQLLDLLKRVLPKATHDPKLAGRIYQAIELELQSKARATAFEKFCDKVELPDLDPKTMEAVQRQFAAAFGDGDITIKPNRKEQTLAVEVMLADGNQFSSEIKVRELGPEATDEQEIAFKFVPFPVCLPGDHELVWLLAKRENMTADEAGIALTKMEADFWASKTGQKLLRDRVERCFPEFIARAPGGMLSEVGLKRHYKTPEPVKMLGRSAPTVNSRHSPRPLRGDAEAKA